MKLKSVVSGREFDLAGLDGAFPLLRNVRIFVPNQELYAQVMGEALLDGLNIHANVIIVGEREYIEGVPVITALVPAHLKIEAVSPGRLYRFWRSTYLP